MTLAEKLSTYDEKYWDFSEYRNDAPLVRYPAVMVAPMQACILKEIINADPTTSTVLDPFCGSGTVLCEGQKLGLNVMGFDINPMAVLIATVQLEGIPEDCAVRSINAINTRLTMLNGNVKSYAFKNINKWFNDDIIVSLSVIRQAIIEETNERMRRFFWCCFAETVKKFSNCTAFGSDLAVLCFCRKNASQGASKSDYSADRRRPEGRCDSLDYSMEGRCLQIGSRATENSCLLQNGRYSIAGPALRFP